MPTAGGYLVAGVCSAFHHFKPIQKNPSRIALTVGGASAHRHDSGGVCFVADGQSARQDYNESHGASQLKKPPSEVTRFARRLKEASARAGTPTYILASLAHSARIFLIIPNFFWVSLFSTPFTRTDLFFPLFSPYVSGVSR